MQVSHLTRTALLLAVAATVQILFRSQLMVGPLVNMIMFLSVMLVGLWSGLVIGSLTPVLAWLTGVMGFPPVLPFIAVANCLMVSVFSLSRGKLSKSLAVAGGAAAKFLFLTASVRWLLPLLVPVPPPLALALSLPQLVTALAGGWLALLTWKVTSLRHAPTKTSSG